MTKADHAMINVGVGVRFTVADNRLGRFVVCHESKLIHLSKTRKCFLEK